MTGKQIADTTLEAISRKGGYIWGQMGATWTAAKQAALEKKYNSDKEAFKNYKLSAEYGSKWIGHPVWDCAGLCRWAAKQNGLAIHAGSNLIWNNDLSKKGKMTTGMTLPVGALVFTGAEENSHPHIGTYTGNGKVTEANGAIKGCIQSNLTDSKWKWWGLEKGVDYEFVPGQGQNQMTEPATTADEKRPTLRKGNKNKYVTEMQTMLDNLGYNLGICGIDGDFGTATEKALKEFQRDHGIGQDGVCGPKSWKALTEAIDKLNAKPEQEKKYTVTISGLTAEKAKEITQLYGGVISAE